MHTKSFFFIYLKIHLQACVNSVMADETDSPLRFVQFKFP